MLFRSGSSARAISNLAKRKGYTLVASTDVNLLLVRKDLSDFVVSEAPKLEELNPQGELITALFCGYDGTLLSNSKTMHLNWHGLTFDLGQIQILPKHLRRFAFDYTRKQMLLFLFLYKRREFYRRLFNYLKRKISFVGRG